MISPRPYQQRAIAAVHEAAAAGARRIIVQMSTGLGKTPTAAWVSRDRGGRSLILAHRDELVRQAADKFRIVSPEIPVGIVKAEDNECDAQVVAASVQTLLSQKRLDQLLASGPFNTVHADETHHYLSDNRFGAVVKAFDAPLTIGWSATPERADNKNLGDLWEKIVFKLGILEGIQSGYLCNIRAKQVKLALDLDAVKQSRGDYQDGALGEALEAAEAPRHIVEAWQAHALGRRTLVFCPTVEMTQRVLEAFWAAKVPADMVWGEQKIEDRREILKRFSLGDMDVLANCAVLLEGYDEPRVDCVVIARPTRSRVLYQQMLGRGCRIHPAKSDLLVLDMVGATTAHDLQTAAGLFGISEGAIEEGVAETIRRIKEEGREPVEGQVVAEEVQLFTRRYLHWIRDGARFLLPAGDETLALAPLEGKWAVRSIPRDRYASVTLLARDLTLEWAQGFAEDHVRGLGTMALAAEAQWRKDPPSVKQLEMLRKWGKSAASKGEAADIITLRFAGRR